jgi:hypothetical protein
MPKRYTVFRRIEPAHGLRCTAPGCNRVPSLGD